MNDESGCLGLQPKLGGRFHLKLNISGRPIAKKYCEGKVKRTLKRRLKVLEIVKRETNGTSVHMYMIQLHRFVFKYFSFRVFTDTGDLLKFIYRFISYTL
ncbi:MAG: hypothetical protein JWR38_5900 [Mucilaginibacter sp.]|nr:hypothetical protein [Mucilaginibacter sp.]